MKLEGSKAYAVICCVAVNCSERYRFGERLVICDGDHSNQSYRILIGPLGKQTLFAPGEEVCGQGRVYDIICRERS